MEFECSSENNFEIEAFTPLKVGDRYELNWASITKWLNIYFKDPSGGIDTTFSEIKIKKLHKVLELINCKFSWYNSLETPIRECLTEALKIIRVYVTNEDVARLLLNDLSFLLVISKLMECIFTKKNGHELYTKYLLQCILNLLSVAPDIEQRRAARERIYKFFWQHFYKYFLGQYGHIYEISAILYNVLGDTDITDEGLTNHIILYHGEADKSNEYLDFLMEKLIASDFLWQIYEDLNFQTKLSLLSCLKEVLISPNSEDFLIKVKVLPLSCLECFVIKFNKSANVIFQVTQSGSINASQEVAYIVELLSHVSSEERSLQHLQNNKDILINAGVLLLNVHRLGQMSDNVFTPIQKVTQTDGQIRNPVFGFKADLVRLIGNLCWKNRRMQDLAREAEVIPVLLDCCNIDEKNPFIIQWVILAIRNICENNSENQAIIAGLTQQGVINPEKLQQFGLTLHAEEDLSVGLIGLDLNR